MLIIILKITKGVNLVNKVKVHLVSSAEANYKGGGGYFQHVKIHHLFLVISHIKIIDIYLHQICGFKNMKNILYVSLYSYIHTL